MGEGFRSKFELRQGKSRIDSQFRGRGDFERGVLNGQMRVSIELPFYSRLVSDCAKMKLLDEILSGLVSGGHRCLIFC